MRRFAVRPVATFAAVLALAAIAAAQNGKSATNQGSAPNGKPFVAIQSQIDALNASVASQGQSIASLEVHWQETAARLDALGADIQTLFDADQALGALILALGAEIDDLTARIAAAEASFTQVPDLSNQLAAAKARLDGLESQFTAIKQALQTGCPAGSSIRQIGSPPQVTCQTDMTSSGVGHLSTTEIQFVTLSVGATSTRAFSMPCTTGTALSGGFANSNPLQNGFNYLVVYESRPVRVQQGNILVTGWQVAVFNAGAVPLNVTGYLRCATVVP